MVDDVGLKPERLDRRSADMSKSEGWGGVPAWRIKNLRIALIDAEQRGADPADSGADLSHRALRRRFGRGRQALQMIARNFGLFRSLARRSAYGSPNVLRDNQNRSPSDNLPYIRWWSSVWRASWCQARSRQRREPEGLGFTAVCLPDIIIAGCSFRWMKLTSVSEA